MTWKIMQGDVRDKLSELPDKHVQTVVTSPPYWGLRDYGVNGQIGKVEQNILVPGGAVAYQQAEYWRQRAEDTKVGLLRERRVMIATMYYLKAIYEEGVWVKNARCNEK